MFNIALCINETEWIAETENMILKYSEANNIPMAVDVFCGLNELGKLGSKVYTYDLFILDLREISKTMPVVITMIREKNDGAEIVFITTKMIQIENWYEIRPIDILVYPFTYERFVKTLHAAIHQINSRYFQFSYKHNMHSVLYEDILYFESINRQINIVATNHKYAFYGKLKEVSLSLPQEEFLYVHKSYIINKRYIQEYSYRECVMTDMRRIPISQINRKEVRNKMKNIKKD